MKATSASPGSDERRRRRGRATPGLSHTAQGIQPSHPASARSSRLARCPHLQSRPGSADQWKRCHLNWNIPSSGISLEALRFGWNLKPFAGTGLSTVQRGKRLCHLLQLPLPLRLFVPSPKAGGWVPAPHPPTPQSLGGINPSFGALCHHPSPLPNRAARPHLVWRGHSCCRLASLAPELLDDTKAR